MSSQFFLMLGLLAGWATAYWAFLTFSDVGRKLNSIPAIVPFLTVLGILPLIPAVGVLWGWVRAAEFAAMLGAIGLPFVLRGGWRIAADYMHNIGIERRNEWMSLYERESK